MTYQIPYGKAITDALTTTGPVQDTEELVSEGFATVAEAAKFFSLGRSKVYALMDAGELTYGKIGKARRIPWRAIRAFARDSLILPP